MIIDKNIQNSKYSNKKLFTLQYTMPPHAFTSKVSSTILHNVKAEGWTFKYMHANTHARIQFTCISSSSFHISSFGNVYILSFPGTYSMHTSHGLNNVKKLRLSFQAEKIKLRRSKKFLSDSS